MLNTTTPGNFADAFDGPVIEPVWIHEADPAAPGGSKRVRIDAHFSRADLDYWESLAIKLRDARRTQALAELSKLSSALNPVMRMQAMQEIYAQEVQIFEVLNLQYSPSGIKKILDDALLRAGTENAMRRKAIVAAIPPGRAQKIAEEICSEPKATIAELRESVKALAIKLGQDPTAVMRWGDDEIIAFATQYTPPPAGAVAQNPTDPGGAELTPGSTGERETPSSELSTSAIPAS